MAATPTAGFALTPEPPGDVDAAVRVIVLLEEQGDGAAVAESVDGGQVREMSELPIVVLEVTPDGIADLEADDRVVAVVEDIPRPPSLAASLPVINGDDVHALGFTGDNSTVAILDTGIDAAHPFYNDASGTSRIVAQFCSSSPAATDEDGLCPNGNTTDTSADVRGLAACLNGTDNICDHGPHVTGIAAGNRAGDPAAPAGQSSGVAPDANIIAMQVFTRFNDDADCGGDPGDAPCVRTYPSDQIAALNELLTLNTNNAGWNIVAANMSLGGGEFSAACDTDPVKAPVDALLAAGIVTAIAAGNDGFRNAVGAPGCISTAFTVGSTGIDDVPTATRNRGRLLDLFAPGNVTSSVPDSAYGFKGGTSMSTPHVAGAFAVLREAYQTRTITELTTAITSTGVPITYAIDTAVPPTMHTTPRLDLLAALQFYNDPPTAGADTTTVTVDEGEVATNGGTWADTDSPPPTLTASSGAVTRNADGTWSWSEQTSDSPAGSKQVAITATDDKGETATATFQLNVDNVAPTVTVSPTQVTVADEGETVSVSATFTDPGYPDEMGSATIDFGAGTGGPQTANLLVTAGSAGTPTTGTISGSFSYGDNGQPYTVTVSLTDKDGGTDSDSFALTVSNLDPSVTIDAGAAITFPGGDYVVTRIGSDVTVGASASDPGSDDLTFGWDDGTNVVTSPHLNNGLTPEPDEPPTPTPLGTFPFAATDSVTTAYAVPGVVSQALEVSDDDGGLAGDDLSMIVTGDHRRTSGQGWWKHQYRGTGRPHLTTDFAQGYLDIVNAVSSVFSESTSATTFARAHAVLSPTGNDARARARSELMQAWLELASGAVRWDSQVPGQGNQPSVLFLDLMFDAESLILDPNATSAQLRDVERALARVQQVR